jgi:hypothetical protein
MLLSPGLGIDSTIIGIPARGPWRWPRARTPERSILRGEGCRRPLSCARPETPHRRHSIPTGQLGDDSRLPATPSTTGGRARTERAGGMLVRRRGFRARGLPPQRRRPVVTRPTGAGDAAPEPVTASRRARPSPYGAGVAGWTVHPWDHCLADFHDERPGITEAVLALTSAADGRTPTSGLADAPRPADSPSTGGAAAGHLPRSRRAGSAWTAAPPSSPVRHGSRPAGWCSPTRRACRCGRERPTPWSAR